MGLRWLCGLLLVLLCLLSCRPEPLGLALKGALPVAESNTVILEYCQTCHIHRAFQEEGHIARVAALYDRPPYTSTTQCRACHLVDEDTWGQRTRKTLWPAEVATNRFRAWEKKVLNQKPATSVPPGTPIRKLPDTR